MSLLVVAVGYQRAYAQRGGRDETRLSRLIDAIEVGHVDATSLADRIGSVQREIETLVAAEANELEAPTRPTVTRDVLRNLIVELGDTARRVFDDADPADLAQLYADLGLAIVYDHDNHTIDVSATPTNSAQLSWCYEGAPGGSATLQTKLRFSALLELRKVA